MYCNLHQPTGWMAVNWCKVNKKYLNMKVFLLLFYAVTDLDLFFFVQSPPPQIFVRILNYHVAKQNKSHEVRNSH